MHSRCCSAVMMVIRIVEETGFLPLSCTFLLVGEAGLFVIALQRCLSLGRAAKGHKK